MNNMPNHVDEITKRYRTNQLLELNKIKALEYRQLFIGKTVEVVSEKIDGNKGFGHSSNYIEVEFTGFDLKLHQIVNVLIEKVGYPVSYGRQVNGNE